jgi:hypothetical protein
MCISVCADDCPGTHGVARRLCEGFERRFDLYLDAAKAILREAGNLE